MSLPIRVFANGNDLSGATAFVATHEGEDYLVTNWHVVAGRHPSGGEALSSTLAVPDQLRILQVIVGTDLEWTWTTEQLYDEDGEPLWLEHPTHGQRVDVVALPLTQTAGVDVNAYDPANPGPSIVFGPSDSASIIGFPFGRSGGGALGIWVQGTIATEPEIEYDDLPCVLIDSRTRPGQSGSPVILYRTNGYFTAEGNMINNGVPATRFVGIYSGRISDESDLGFVWKAKALVEILSAQTRGPIPTIG
jgi:hypothetical protein